MPPNTGSDDAGVTDDDADEDIDPSDPDAISEALGLPGVLREGPAPLPSEDAAAPAISGTPAAVTTSNGSTALVTFAYQSDAGYSDCYVAVDGASGYWDIPAADVDVNETAGTITVPIQIPANVLAGTFCTSTCIADAEGRVSNVEGTCFTVLRLGSGALQVNLAWDTETDVDLYVSNADGEEIYYANPTGLGGGALDRDDTDGFGPENIFWANEAPDGEYQVAVEYYAGDPPTSYVVTVNGAGQSRQVNGTLAAAGERDEVLRIVKSGDSLSFE